ARMPNAKRLLRLSNRSFLAFIFFFSMSTTCLYFIYAAPGIANTYFFMVQAQGIMLRDNVRTIGQIIRSYTNKNSTLNGTDYPEGNNSSEYFAQPTTYLPENFTYAQNLPCPERLPSMKGPMEVNMTELSFEAVELHLRQLGIQYGGHWKPEDCQPRWKVAFLIPFRNRHEHLPILFQHLAPMLQRQHLQFAFYVIEQVCTHTHTQTHTHTHTHTHTLSALVFLPRQAQTHKPFDSTFSLPYNEFFGGVSGLTVEQFRKINGFPNAFWGWGGEDDDLWNRVHFAGLNVTRPEGDIGKYKSIPHHHRGEVQFLGRYKLLRYSKERQFLDGLNNLQYSPEISISSLYKNISVNLSPELAPIAEY
ncbi:beta-1,4-galactosyltransferase 6, partial [Silurus meridionalis]